MGGDSKNAKLNLQKEFEELQKNQKAIQKCVETRQKLEAQLTENTVVKDELDLLEVYEANVCNIIFLTVGML